MFQEVAEIFLPLGSGNKADRAVKGGVQAILLQREKFARSVSKVEVSKFCKVSSSFGVWESRGLNS